MHNLTQHLVNSQGCKELHKVDTLLGHTVCDGIAAPICSKVQYTFRYSAT
jgi:hypothetical protein